jgi:hypothetical protein
MADKTAGIFVLDVVNVNTTGSKALHAACIEVRLKARAVDGRLQLEADDDTEYWTLTADVELILSGRNLHGKTLYFSSGADTNIEIMQVKDTVA